MEKVAVPTVEDNVDSHFGHAEMFLIYNINEKKEIESTEYYKPAIGCGCKSGLAGDLKGLGVSTLLAGNMGQGAQNTLKNNGINVFTGFSGKAEGAVRTWLSGDFVSLLETCEGGHHHGHSCSHHNH